MFYTWIFPLSDSLNFLLDTRAEVFNIIPNMLWSYDAYLWSHILFLQIQSSGLFFDSNMQASLFPQSLLLRGLLLTIRDLPFIHRISASYWQDWKLTQIVNVTEKFHSSKRIFVGDEHSLGLWCFFSTVFKRIRDLINKGEKWVWFSSLMDVWNPIILYYCAWHFPKRIWFL